ncbi:LysM peptidoglycan-binding domain-containing protein [Oceanicoccus sp. KOV_DT_Chl]|uniref:lytic transglycosylase n=1 Tax=Oceanicoccus sp. KOV_DT_Chl TaxID=1904639 RepID=UPI000C7E7BF9|nr:LysM peptidoglycan-binding domain-containing protein [Oceanicoccus sp. KOV_DT_Chl]
MKLLLISKLYFFIQVISILLLQAGCQSIGINNKPLNDPPIAITHDMAAALTDADPWEYFTDFSSPYACIHSIDEPQATEPNWVEPDTIWPRIRLGFQLDWGLEQKRLDAEFNWYQRHPEYMSRVSNRARRYIYHVTEQLEQAGLPLELALLPIVESAYDPFAYSHGRASGMWQFIPGTARMYHLQQSWWYDGRRDIIDSTAAAISLLERLADYYDGDWLLALAAYNSGQGNVNKAIRKNKKRGKPTDFWSLDLPRETRSYVPKLLALAKLVDNPRRYGIDLYPVPNQPYFATVSTQSQIDLAQAASMAEIDIDELYLLNPGYNRWATDPSGPHRLLVPLANESIFEQALTKLPPSKRLHWQRHTVKEGESLLLLAKRFNTGVDTIKQINSIRGNMIRAGQSLMIPMASQAGEHYSLSADQRLTTIHEQRTGGANTRQIFYTVKSGDSLWTIAQKHHVSTSKLAHWNGIAPKDLLKPGQKLSIWLAKNNKQAKGTTAPVNQRKNVVKKVGYKVRNGDSLARIADKFNLRITDIVKWNKVNPKKYLQPGQRLTLYVNVMNTIN